MNEQGSPFPRPTGAHVMAGARRAVTRLRLGDRAVTAPFTILLAVVTVAFWLGSLSAALTAVGMILAAVSLLITIPIFLGLARKGGSRRSGRPALVGVGLLVVNIYAIILAGAAGDAIDRPISPRFGSYVLVLIIGVFPTTIAALPWWLHLRDKRTAQTAAAAQEDAGDFPGVPWLKGARWTGEGQTTRTGRSYRLALPPGVPGRKFVAGRTDDLAAVLELRPDQVELIEGKHAGEVVVRVHDRDVLAQPVPWPMRDALSVSLWEPVPVGRDRNGDDLAVSLIERHLLIAGESGSGKSNLQALLVSAAALDAFVDLQVIDGKGGADLGGWRGRASAFVGADPAAACDLLATLQEDLNATYAALAAKQQRKIPKRSPLTVLAIDELASFLLDPDRRTAEEFRKRLTDLLQRGRAAGLIVIAATQHPSADLLSAELRAGFTARIVLRTSTAAASRMMLGDGVEADASRLDPDRHGLAWATIEGRLRLLRCHLLDDAALLAIQRRNARHNAPAAPAAPTRKPAQAPPPGLKFPDGSRVPPADAKLWAALTAAEDPLSVAELLALDIGLKSYSPVEARLKRWAAAGHVVRHDDGRAKRYTAARRTDQEEIA